MASGAGNSRDIFRRFEKSLGPLRAVQEEFRKINREKAKEKRKIQKQKKLERCYKDFLESAPRRAAEVAASHKALKARLASRAKVPPADSTIPCEGHVSVDEKPEARVDTEKLMAGIGKNRLNNALKAQVNGRKLVSEQVKHHEENRHLTIPLLGKMKIRKSQGGSMRNRTSGSVVGCLTPTYMYCAASPVGRLDIAICPKGLHSIDMRADRQLLGGSTSKGEAIMCELAMRDDKTGPPDSVVHHAQALTSWLNAYFGSPSTLNSAPVPSACGDHLSIGGPFARLVRTTLAASVPCGSRLTYSELAARCGNAKASRAVGQAMRTNPLPILIPCHRVVLASGAVGNYSGGTKNAIKKWLLDHEAGRSSSVSVKEGDQN